MQNNQPLKILFVDDEESIVYFHTKIFENLGHKVFGCSDGVKAVEVYKKEKPHIVFIDVHMPFSPIDGIEVLQQIKEVDKDAVCLILTRITDKQVVARAKELGALAYLIKPVDNDEMEKVLEKSRGYIK